MESLSLVNRVAEVRERIDVALHRSGRADAARIVAVTKTYPAALVRDARDAGLPDVGENRVAEMQGKVEEVGRDAVRWHLIGHLQRNKARRAIPLFDLLHSLDSVRLARQLSDDATSLETEVRALVQVNTSGEESKFGFDPGHAIDAIGEMAEMPGLRLVGLMTMAPYTADEAVLRRTFRGASRLREEAARQVPGFQAVELSMGMSNDFEIAVEEGSTLVRLGTVLFGEREL
ncbi:YggS family pyridoxal phosphate-dependent enzyme [soil metagenome]|nr:YggS family pyridoxal phosphate-dependent enzyme [Gemmatimonadota bacterium]